MERPADLAHRFRDDGVVAVPDLLDVDARQALTRHVAELATPGPHRTGLLVHHERLADGTVVPTRTEDLLPHHAGIRALLTEGPPVHLASLLLGEPAAVMKEKINHKLPGGGGYAPHQDLPAYPHGARHVTMLLAIDDCDADNGCLEFARGRHRDGLLPTDDRGCIAAGHAADLGWEPFPVAAGGAVFFDSLAPHRSAPNRSSRPRRALYVTYHAAREGDLRSRYYAHKREALADAPDGATRLSLIGHFEGRVTPADGVIPAPPADA